MVRKNPYAIGAALAAAAGMMLYRAAARRRLARFDTPVVGRRATAAITGASSGIGAAYARSLALLGYDLLLIARRADRLDALARELERRHAVSVRSIAADLSSTEDIRRVATELSRTQALELLVNNAGFGTIGAFAEVAIQGQTDQVMVHVFASVELARAALPNMLARRRGAVVSVASTAAWAGLPGNVTYSATKRFLVTFSEGLQAELDGTGVFAQALCPGFTYTEFHDKGDWANSDFRRNRVPAFLWMTADEVVSASLADLGTGAPVLVPGALNRAIVGVMAITPRDAIARSARRALRRFMRR